MGCFVGLSATFAPALIVSGAQAETVSGPRESISLGFSSRSPGVSAGSAFAGTYHAAGDPQAAPPALHRVRLTMPPGSRFDTSVPARCQATDMQLELMGESACPVASKVGSGTVTTSFLGTSPSSYDVTVFNTDGGELELVKFGNGGSAVAHATIRGNLIDTQVPTCLGGGQPPQSCPTDEAVVLANALAGPALTVNGRGYFTLPSSCPATGVWTSTFAFYFADGSTDALSTAQPCDQVSAKADRQRSSHRRRHHPRRGPAARR